jgi:hypothetical protein
LDDGKKGIRKVCGRKRQWPDLRCCPGICLDEVRFPGRTCRSLVTVPTELFRLHFGSVMTFTRMFMTIMIWNVKEFLCRTGVRRPSVRVLTAFVRCAVQTLGIFLCIPLCE